MFDNLIRQFNTWIYPEENPVPQGSPSFDPKFGFDGQREERVMIATEAELRAAKIPKEKWDYCAHKLLELERCKADNFPFLWKCKHESHDTSMCYFDDFVLRMKEYERERRLIQRELRLKQKA